MQRTAVYSGTRNLYHDMSVSAKSLFYHNGADRAFFLIEDDAFPDLLPDCISVVNISGQQYFPRDGPNYHSPWTYMVLLRAAYTKIFQHLDTVLTIDCDTLAFRDVSGLWDTPISGKYFAAVREIIRGESQNNPGYNFGVALINLAQLRDGTDDRIISLLNTQYLVTSEQSAFNLLCAGHIAELPPEYNSMWYSTLSVPDSCCKIKHFANDRPMSEHYRYRFFDHMSWDTVIRHQKGAYHERTGN